MKAQRFKSFLVFFPIIIIVFLTIMGIIDSYFDIINRTKNITKEYKMDRTQNQPIPTSSESQCLPCSQ